MQLSIIIVSYNVRNFINLCLSSIKSAKQNIELEIIIVDNNSEDDSVNYIKKNFDWIELIENKENIGFSKANNQAIKQAKGKYILILNPDTIIEENTLVDCIDFMEKTSNCGALGVKMIGFDGKFQPESKRGFPTPAVSFYKMFGFSKLFPNSKTFGRYNLSYLPENEINKIEILSGAFMFVRKTTLEKSGSFDEDYFMYGEDIDLSYRILQSGFENYYFPKTKILHFKGESTKKNESKYIYTFYNAMKIFAIKHFNTKETRFFLIFIKFAINLRILLSLINLKIKKAFRRQKKENMNQNSLIISEKMELVEIKEAINGDFEKQNYLHFSISNFEEFNQIETLKREIIRINPKKIIISFSVQKKMLIDIIHSLSEEYIDIKLYIPSEKKFFSTKNK